MIKEQYRKEQYRVEIHDGIKLVPVRGNVRQEISYVDDLEYKQRQMVAATLSNWANAALLDQTFHLDASGETVRYRPISRWQLLEPHLFLFQEMIPEIKWPLRPFNHTGIYGDMSRIMRFDFSKISVWHARRLFGVLAADHRAIVGYYDEGGYTVWLDLQKDEYVNVTLDFTIKPINHTKHVRGRFQIIAYPNL